MLAIDPNPIILEALRAIEIIVPSVVGYLGIRARYLASKPPAKPPRSRKRKRPEQP